MRSLLIMLIGLTICFSSFAQEPAQVERSNNKVIIDDKVYYIHVVKPGQTLYSISKAYNVSQKEIAIENPGAISGLQIGQALKIPVDGTYEIEDPVVRLEPSGGKTKMHLIAEGETIYSISRQYNLDVDSLIHYNGGVDINEMRIGDSLIIPIYADEKESEQPAFNEEGFVYHKVKRRETLYSISRYYEIAVSDIRAANPELGWGGPKNGQVIKIPLPQIIDDDFIALDTIPVDSLNAIMADTIIEDYNYRELSFEDYRPRKTYKLAFFIPFNYYESEPLDSLLKDVTSVNSRNRITERYRMDQAVPQSVNFLEFFEGALLAIDSLKDMGMKLDIRVYDTKRSVSRVSDILGQPDMEDMDLIIGPFYSFILDSVSDFCKVHNIPLITPFHSDFEYMRFNPYLFQITTSYQFEFQKAVKYISRNFDKNIILIHDGDSLETDKINYFKELLFAEFRDYSDVDDVVLKELVLDNNQPLELVHSLSADKKNLVIVPSGDEALASRIVSSLFFQLKDFDIELYGMSSWPEFTSIDVQYFHDLNLTFSHPGMMSYEDPGIDRFLTEYRKNYYAEPAEKTRNGSFFAFMGYDITLYFLSALREYGPRFVLKLDDYYPDLLLCDYKFRRVTSYGGYENVNLKYYRFDPEMNIKMFELYEEPETEFIAEPFDDGHRRTYLIMDGDKPEKNSPDR